MTKKTIHEICKLLELGYGNKFIAESLGVNKNLVKHIKHKEMWIDISKNYNIPIPNKVSRRSEALVTSIKIMIDHGFKNSEIIKMIGLKNNSKNRSYVKNIRRKTNSERFNDYQKSSSDNFIDEIILFKWELE